MKAVVIVPARNEAQHIKEVVQRSKKYVKDVIVVDDNSSDNTRELAEQAGADVVEHIVNLGKGAALKTGCEYALQKGADVMVAVDGDLQHNPDEIPHFLEQVKNNDIVFGYREMKKDMPLVLKLGNWFMQEASTILFHIKVRDTQCGFRAFTADAYRKIRWYSQDYSVESEMIALTGKNNLRFSQLPIQTIYTDKYKGTTVFDGIKIVKNMIWWRMTR